MSSDALANIIWGAALVLIAAIGWMIKTKFKRDDENRKNIWKKLNGHTAEFAQLKVDYPTEEAVEKYVELKQSVLIEKLNQIMRDIKEIKQKLG